MSAALAPERVAELEKAHGDRQTGGQAVGIDADDPVAVLNLVRDRGPRWVEKLAERAEKLEAEALEVRALIERVTAAQRAVQ